jgi:hypothetical protein
MVQIFESQAAPANSVDPSEEVLEGSMMRACCNRNPLSGDRTSYVRKVWVESVGMDIFGIFGGPFEQIVSVVTRLFGYL